MYKRALTSLGIDRHALSRVLFTCSLRSRSLPARRALEELVPTKLQTLSAKRAKLLQRLDQVDLAVRVEERKDRANERKREQRRTFLLGRLMLHMCEADRRFEKRVMQKLDDYLDRPRDRELFGLEPNED